jgi:thiamine-phosphate diphosphorylase
VRPLPRLHAITDARVLARDDLGLRAAAIAAAGSAVALHARDRGATAAMLFHTARRLATLVRPPEAALMVSGRPDVARAVEASGVQLAGDDLSPADARRVLGPGWIGRSVHSADEARAARAEGADYVVAGNVYATASHPERPARGLAFVREVATAGLPVIAIGGITAARAADLRDAGAWGVASVTAVWDADDPYAAALALLAPWSDA